MTYAPYPRCGWHQESIGPGGCLMVGLVDVQLPEGGTATLCTVHADRFASRTAVIKSRVKHWIIPNQIEDE